MQLSPKIPLGLSGFVARTASDQAGFSLNFTQQFETGPKVLKLLYRTNGRGYRLRLMSGSVVWEAQLSHDEKSSSGSSRLDIELPHLANVIHIDVSNPARGPEDFFELHGLSIENLTPGGVFYHNLGVGGATFASLLAQAHFASQSAWFSPSLIILDWGTNDLIYQNNIPQKLEQTIVDTIQKVRAQHPNTLILMTSVQDMYFRRRPINAAWDFTQLIRRLAQENDCLFYDWYRVAGGLDAMRTWYAYGLAKPDHVHLTAAGYAVKGELLGQSILNAVAWRDANPDAPRLWAASQLGEAPHSVSAWLKSTHAFERRPDLIELLNSPTQDQSP